MMEAREAQLLALLAEHHSLGNGKARELLGWDEATYARVKEGLVAKGQVVQGRLPPCLWIDQPVTKDLDATMQMTNWA
jgi:hypothetical protein